MSSSKVLVLCSAIIIMSSFFYLDSVRAQQNRFYAGYSLYGNVSDGYSGVVGDIVTINPYVSSSNFICEWVSIVLNYWPIPLWVQVGYWKGEGSSYQLKYYWEVHSYYGYSTNFLDTPRPSYLSWHNYMIAHPYDYGESPLPEEYRFYIDGTRIVPQQLVLVNPYWPIDQQAFVETTSGTVIIDGSHVKNLSYLTNDHYWHWARWDTHLLGVDHPPYSVLQTQDYEFYANGGG